MDSVFGIGLPELMVILILAGLVLGPQRVRQVARTLGKWTAQLQKVSRKFARDLNAELDSIDSGEMKGTIEDFRELQREVKALRSEFGQASQSLVQEGKDIVQDAEEAVKGPTSPDKNGLPEENVGAATGSDETTLPGLLEVPSDPEYD